jgi:hypothetical protein
MKRLILAVCITVTLSVPCLAQEVETEGTFSLEGTLWRMHEISIVTFPPFLDYSIESIGFHQGVAYVCDEYYGCHPRNNFTVIESPLGAIGMAVNPFLLSVLMETHIYLPNGSGFMSAFAGGIRCVVPFLMFKIGYMFKVEDNWIPEETILDISPEYGLKGATVSCYISSSCTTFEKNPPVEIRFEPPDGLTVSNIDVVSDDGIYFDVAISVDAPAGTRRVIVLYDDGNKVVENSDVVFEVIPPGEILSVSPNQGAQGTTVTGVTIMTKDTYFEDFGVWRVILFPAAGLTISNLNVTSNTEIEFDLEIAVDAPVGKKEVYVVAGGRELWNSEVFFTVTEKSN